jgi:hypothetical protein
MMKGIKFHASSYMRRDSSPEKSNLIVVMVDISFKSSVSWGRDWVSASQQGTRMKKLTSRNRSIIRYT